MQKSQLAIQHVHWVGYQTKERQANQCQKSDNAIIQFFLFFKLGVKAITKANGEQQKHYVEVKHQLPNFELTTSKF
jgi:hypothetical protein